RLDARELAQRVVRLIDQADFTGKPRPDTPIVEAYFEFTDEQRKTSRNLTWHDPNRFSMSLGLDPETGQVLAIPFHRSPEYQEALQGSGMFTEYGYWNNSDQPEGVTDVQWEERKQAWKRVIPGFSAPIEHMLSFDLRGESGSAGMLELAYQQEDSEPHPLVTAELADITRRERAADRARIACADALSEADPDG